MISRKHIIILFIYLLNKINDMKDAVDKSFFFCGCHMNTGSRELFFFLQFCSVNFGLPQGSDLALTLSVLNINDWLHWSFNTVSFTDADTFLCNFYLPKPTPDEKNQQYLQDESKNAYYLVLKDLALKDHALKTSSNL